MHTLVPIAAVYVIAHYFSLLAYNGQAIVYLASDPLGQGLGPVRHRRQGDRLRRDRRDRRSGTCRSACWWSGTSAASSWRTTARWRIYGKARAATTSQYWMLAVMVAFTTFGLFLLSQANQ